MHGIIHSSEKWGAYFLCLYFILELLICLCIYLVIEVRSQVLQAVIPLSM